MRRRHGCSRGASPTRLSAVLAVALAACASPELDEPALPSTQVTADSRADLDARHRAEFQRADLFKPAMDAADLDPYQAPLVYVECDSGDAGELEPTRDDALSARAASPAVYFREEPASPDGVRPRAITFAWFVPTDDGARLQGLRTTFGAGGRPALVEISADRTGAAVLYAARSLERAAAERLGEPLPDEFALTARLAPHQVLVGTFEDGPMAMGPYLYHGAGSTDVWNLHCRCEPTRAHEIRELVEYRLRPLAELESDEALSFAPFEQLVEALRPATDS